MLKTIDHGFTLYIRKGENRLTCTGLKSLGSGKGMYSIELQRNELLILEQFPYILKLLGEGKILQIYKNSQFPYLIYIAQIGKVVPEGPYAELDCLEVISEGVGSDFYDALIGLEKEVSKLEESTNLKSLKKVYRLYGMDKYVTCNTNL